MSNSIISTINPKDIPFKLPNNWKWFKWGDLVIDYQQGLIRSNRELNKTGTLYLKMNNLDNAGSYDLNKYECAEVTKEELEIYKLNKGDFLLNVRNSKELVGKTCVIHHHDFDMVFNHMLVRIKHRKGISSIFINALLKTPVMRKFIDKCKTGTTTVIALYQRDLYEIPIPIPDELTQNSIANFVELISNKVQLNNRINAELEAMAKTVFHKWFIENKEKADWETGKLGDIAENIRRSVAPKEIKSETHYIGLEHMPRKSIALAEYGNASEIESNKYAFKENEFLFGKLRPYFHKVGIAPFDGICSTDILVIVAKSHEWYGYVLGHISSDEIIKYADATSGGTKMPRTNWENLTRFEIQIPPIELALKFSEFFVPIAQQIRINILENAQLTQLRDWLLPMLMNGQVRVIPAE